MPTKQTTIKPRASKIPKKPRTIKKKEAVLKEAPVKAKEIKPEVKQEKAHITKERYIFSTGRRKTSIANVRLFSGKGSNFVNKKPFEKYFQYKFDQEEAKKPFDVTGLEHEYNFTASISGGGMHSQAQALKHGIAIALGKVTPEIRKVLKKNGLLTRDDRKKERKKPGLKRARRSPQWAKR